MKRPTLCACGCGLETSGHSYGRSGFVQYRHGHYVKARHRQGQLGWLAGMIDGEGHIGILFVKPRKPTHRGTYQVCLDVTNADRAAMEMCRSITGVGALHH